MSIAQEMCIFVVVPAAANNTREDNELILWLWGQCCYINKKYYTLYEYILNNNTLVDTFPDPRGTHVCKSE